MNFLIQLLIGFALLSPLVIVYGIQKKKNRVRHIIVDFSTPDGSRRSMPIRIGFSWTIFLFKGWALLFRGQFFEFVILFFMGSLLSSIAIGALVDFDYDALFVAGSGLMGQTPEMKPMSEIFAEASTWGIIGYITFTLMHTALIYYFILFGNKIRLKNLYARGYRFDNPQNGNIDDLYEYIGMTRPKPQSELGDNVRQGASHTYVVPEKPVVEEDPNDYSGLALSDLKLLLRSEGIQFDPSSTKEELLELVSEHLTVEKKSKTEVEDYTKLTVAELKIVLKEEGLLFPSSATKTQLLEMLNEHFKSKK